MERYGNIEKVVYYNNTFIDTLDRAIEWKYFFYTSNIK